MSTYIPTLQEEVNRKAYDAVAELLGMLESGAMSAAQAELFLNVLQTAFNGIVTDGDFCSLLSETSIYLANCVPMKQSFKVTLNKETFKDMILVVEGCTLTVDATRREFDTPQEAFKACVTLVEKLKIAGYRAAKV